MSGGIRGAGGRSGTGDGVFFFFFAIKRVDGTTGVTKEAAGWWIRRESEPKSKQCLGSPTDLMQGPKRNLQHVWFVESRRFCLGSIYIYIREVAAARTVAGVTILENSRGTEVTS